MQTDYDVIIVGAGISGIAAAHHLQTRCPGKSFAILEARDSLGGTWDLFRYPGIRSDSDMHTLGFSFRPWRDRDSIASGDKILAYLKDTAAELGLDKKIRYRTRVKGLSWSSADSSWTLHTDTDDGEVDFTCNFVFGCTGYYRYDAGYTPEFPGHERFRGQIVHPQQWNDEVDYAGKRVVVIGSGATAMTMVPAMADDAEHVTMLQRSPTYVVSVPQRDRIAEWLVDKLDERAYPVIRWKNVLLGLGMYQFSRRFPERARRFFMGRVREELPGFDVDTHFGPSYDPWDQRLCLVPDGDLFDSIRRGVVSVVTDHIDSFTEDGILLRSGDELKADLIVTATGLVLEFLGGARVELDGEPVDIGQTMLYKGMMLSGIPNAGFCLGYSNASWTLKCELSCEYLCGLLNHMDAHGFRKVTPQRDPEVDTEPPLDLDSGYVKRALSYMPNQGSRKPWRLYQNYILDTLTLRRARVEDDTLSFA